MEQKPIPDPTEKGPKMNEEKTSGKMLDIILGLFCTMAMGLSAFSLKFAFDSNAKQAVQQEQISQILNNKVTDENQNKQITIMWKHNSWERDQIAEIRAKVGLPPAPSPNLGNN